MMDKSKHWEFLMQIHQGLLDGNFSASSDEKLEEFSEILLVVDSWKKEYSQKIQSTDDLRLTLLYSTVVSCLFEQLSLRNDDDSKDVKEVCHFLIQDKQFLNNLIVLLAATDKFVSHAYMKCLVSVLGAASHLVPLPDILSRVIQKCIETNQDQTWTTYLGVFSSILSSRCSNTVLKSEAARILQRTWIELVDKIGCNILKPENSIASLTYSVHSVMPFLILWQKMIKYENVHCSTDLSMKRSVTKILSEEPYLLFKLIRKDCSHVVCRKIFDILLLALNNSDKTYDEDDEIFLKMAKKILEAVTNGLLEKLPYNAGCSGFGGPIHTDDRKSKIWGDQILLRKVCLTVLKSLALTQGEQGPDSPDAINYRSALHQLSDFLHDQSVISSEVKLYEIIFFLFVDQDDGLIESMLHCLVIQEFMLRLNIQDDILLSFNPHDTFLYFLATISYDYSVLLDLLTSPETCFLRYFLKYLKLVLREWDWFVDSHRDWSGNIASHLQSIWAERDEKEFHSNCPSVINTNDILGSSSSLGASENFLSENSGEEFEDKAGKDFHGEAFPSFADESQQGQHGCEGEDDTCAQRTFAELPSNIEKLELKQSCDIADSPVSNRQVTDETKQAPPLVSYDCSDESDNEMKCQSLQETISGDSNSGISGQIRRRDDHVKTSADVTFAANLQQSSELLGARDVGSSLHDAQQMLHGTPSCPSSSKTDDTLDDSNHHLHALDKTMTVLIRLRMAVQRIFTNGLFPYNPTPLIHLLEKCEDLYEM